MEVTDFDDLMTKYPRLIKPGFGGGYGFECGTGWISILDRYFGEVDALLPADVPWSNRQIKEKFGTLRLYCEALWPGKEPTAIFAVDFLNMGSGFRHGADGNNGIDQKLDWARYRAEGRSAHTCEHCGKRGVLMQSGGWYHTACEEHADGGVPVGGESVLTFGGKRYCFDVVKDDIVEIEGDKNEE
ncbi:hypothetical protein [Mesorhizobium sp. A623]